MYANLSEITLQYGMTEIAQLMDDEEGNIVSDLLRDALAGDTSAWSTEEQSSISQAINRAEQIIQQQMMFIDSRISSRYPVPLSDSNARATPVHICCMALVRAALADDATNLAEQVATERDYWRTWLRDVSNGKALLPGITAVSDGSGTRQQRLSAQVKSNVDWERY